MEPITNEERFMAAAAGQSVDLPEPITRREKFLKAIADNVGSGGGGGASSWNDLKDRPFGEEVVEESVVGLEITLSIIQATTIAYQHNLNIPFQVGQVWDVAGNRGSPWTGQEVKQADDGTIYIGDYPNANVVPFYVTPNEIKCSMGWVNAFQLTDVNIVCVSGTVTETTIKKLDFKYLPTPIILHAGPDPTGESTGAFLYKDAGLTQAMYYDEFMQRFENGEKLFVKFTYVDESEVDETVIALAVSYKHSLHNKVATVTFDLSGELVPFRLSFK